MADRPRARDERKPSKNPPTSAEEARRATQGNEVTAHSVRPVMSSQERHERIALGAYQRAQARGFEPGGELEDWLLAERELEEELSRLDSTAGR
jgi:Protein of unknown function (DUF2934)